MKNKGFSMVELIIVIAVMAILAGALAPMLIKYINRARISSDIDTGALIGRTVMTAVTNEAAFVDAVEHTDTPQKVNQMDGPKLKQEVFDTLGCSGTLEGKSKKDKDGNNLTDREFYYTLDSSRNKVTVFYGGTSDDYQVYPIVGDKFN